MMIPLQEVLNKYNVHPKGVIQVGAHWAEEHDEFVRCGISKFVYIEPCEEAWKIIANKFMLLQGFCNQSLDLIGLEGGGIKLFPFACGAEEVQAPMYVSHQNQGQSNSLLEPKLHLEQHREVVFDDAELVKVAPLDKLISDKSQYDFLYMDVQGYEGEVLKGATETLKNIKIIYTEVNRGQTYAGNMEIDELDCLLLPHGFERVETHWPSPNWTWGDAVYIKTRPL